MFFVNDAQCVIHVNDNDHYKARPRQHNMRIKDDGEEHKKDNVEHELNGDENR